MFKHRTDCNNKKIITEIKPLSRYLPHKFSLILLPLAKIIKHYFLFSSFTVKKDLLAQADTAIE